MTVLQNLQFFCEMRNLSWDLSEKYIDKMLEEVSLMDKKDSIVSTLSGGQKRKLQLIIALAGDTKFILLDEPSSGMDPTARRDTWELIKS